LRECVRGGLGFPAFARRAEGHVGCFLAKWWNWSNTAFGAASRSLPELKRCEADANEVVKRAIVVLAFSGVIFLLT
jgi:hypothetical protein